MLEGTLRSYGTWGAGEGARARRVVGQRWLRATLPPSRSLAVPPQQGKMGKEDEKACGSYKDCSPITITGKIGSTWGKLN